MKIHIITIFPESFDSYFSSSIMSRAQENGLFELIFYKLNDYSDKRFKQVDSKAYGMHGQVLDPEPLSRALEDVFEKVGKKIPVVYMTPSWELLTQKSVEGYVENLWEDFIIICGHYEWIDQRIIDIYVDYCVSIGEYVLSSGELSASVFIDALVRHIPGTLWNPESLNEESFSEKLDRKKEYPVYTRPEIFQWKSVPEILLSWNHKKIEEWKKQNLS